MKTETVKEFIKRIWGDCTEKQREGLFWHCTAFPCINIPELEKQLKKVREDSGGDYDLAMAQVEKSINKTMGERTNNENC